MKSPEQRETVHHVRTERGVSTYQIRKGAGEKAEVLASVVVSSGGESVHCVTCHLQDCRHANRIRERVRAGR